MPQISPAEICSMEVCTLQLSPVEALMREIHLPEMMTAQPSEGTDIKNRSILHIQHDGHD